jgi:hypothetical protein
MAQVDPLLPFKIGPVNGRQAGESGLRRTNQTVFHHRGVEKRPDEFEHTLIGHSRGDARHQAVAIGGGNDCRCF